MDGSEGNEFASLPFEGSFVHEIRLDFFLCDSERDLTGNRKINYGV